MSQDKNQPTQSLTFTLSEDQYQRLQEWKKEVDERIAKDQLETGIGLGGSHLDDSMIKMIRRSLAEGKPRPYYGMIGGVYRYSFTPTSLGDEVKVENTVSGETIDLSEYELW